MISVYDKGNTAYEKNGNVIVFPTKGSVRMAAGGNYEMSMNCPMDAEGNWKHLIREAIVKSPVPKETIENAFAGMDVDVYITTEAAALRSGPSEPQTITYQSWVSGKFFLTYNNICVICVICVILVQKIYKNRGKNGIFLKFVDQKILFFGTS